LLSSPAFLLRIVNYRESDRIVTLYTRELGRVGAMAKAARGSRRRFAGALEHFVLFDAVLTPPGQEGRLYRLMETTLRNSHAGLAANLEALSAAASLLELVAGATPEGEPDTRLFDGLAAGISTLAGPAPLCARAVFIACALSILRRTGFAVSTGGCNICGTPLPEGRSAYFDPARGGVVCTSCGGGPLRLPAGAAALLGRLAGVSPAEAAGTDGDGTLFAPLEEALEQFIRRHLEKDLKTFSFRKQVSPA
jgi:DNA repair protein RecO (recombination protein O)